VPKARFVYEIYIAASAETVWKALLDGEFTRQYWNADNVSDWRAGSAWEHRRADAARTLLVLGEVVEAVAPERLVITWADPADRHNKSRHSRVTFDLEALGATVKLSVTHVDLDTSTDMATKVANGWPRVLSSLKSLLETGRALDTRACS
jgi:uncharacterized protein YndB with AHSA1/START domain